MKEIFLALLLICLMSYVTLVEKDMEQNQELKQIEIVKQAENSNDTVLKQKAERIKADIQAKEAKIEAEKIQAQQSKERIAKIEQETGLISGSLEMIAMVLGIMFLIFGFHFINKIFNGRN